MKITHVITDTNIGGAGVLLSLITGALAKRFDTEIILPKSSMLKDRLPKSDVKITELDIAGDRSFCPIDVMRFYKYFKATKPDVLHTHAGGSARLAGRLVGIRCCISTRHCARPDEISREKSFIERRLYNFCTSLTVSTADCATKNLILEGVDKSRIVTIKNGTLPLKRSTDEENRKLRRKLQIPEDSLIVGSCARLEWVKGQDLLLRAAARLVKKRNIHLLIVGDGSMRGAYHSLAASLGILKRVSFVGFKDDPSPYQNLFYVNVNSSRGTETSCLATSECMSLGIPSCVSDFGGNTEQILDGENGLVFNSDDDLSLENALYRMLTDKSLYERLSLGALSHFSERHSLARMAREYENLYRGFEKH